MSLVVVLTDANVLYSRVLRDYLMYAARTNVVQIRWSREILDEMSRNLVANGRMDADGASALERRMNTAQPRAMVDVTADDYAVFADLPMDDPGDRHVVAAAVAAEADCICTDNLRHFPVEVMARIGADLVRPGDLLAELFEQYPDDLLEAHGMVLEAMRSTTDERTVEALRRAAGDGAADALRRLLDGRGGGRGGTGTTSSGPVPSTSASKTPATGAVRCKGCGRILTNEESIRRGYGPKCAEKAIG